MNDDELKQKLEEDVTCPICLERLKSPLTLTCLHSYCRVCLTNYVFKFSKKSTTSSTDIVMPCPQCRIVITLPPTGIDGFKHNHTLQSIVDNLALHDGQKETKSRKEEEEETNKDVQVEKEEEEDAVASTSLLMLDENNEDKTETETSHGDDDNNNGLNQQQEVHTEEEEERMEVTSTNADEFDDSCCSSTEVLKPQKPPPPRPPPPCIPRPETANAMLYPDITDEKAKLQLELNKEERPIDFDPCKDGLLFKFGKYGGEESDFRKPYGLAVSPQGDVFISDLSGNRILHYHEHGQFLNKIVADCDIHDISLFPNGLLLVATSKARNAILRVYNVSGSLLAEYSGLHYKYAKPSGVAIGVDNYAVVTSLENNCVYVFTEKGKPSKNFGWKGAGNEHFNAPAFLTTNQKNHIIVSDMGNNCLKVFSMEGTFKYSFGQKGKDVGMLLSPMGVCTDNDNNVIVADAGNFRVQAFSPKGRFLGCPLMDTFKIGPNIRPINVAMDRRNNIVVLLLGTQFAEVRTYLWTPPPPDVLQDSIMKFTGSSMSKMFGSF